MLGPTDLVARCLTVKLLLLDALDAEEDGVGKDVDAIMRRDDVEDALATDWGVIGSGTAVGSISCTTLDGVVGV